MTLCSPFPSTAVATSRQRQKEGGGAEMYLERWIKQSEEEGEIMRRERSDERLLTCTLALSYHSIPPALQLLLQRSLFVASFLTFLNLCPHFTPPYSAEAESGHPPPTGSSEVCGGGLAVSNEIPSVRFQTFTTSLAFSNTRTK